MGNQELEIEDGIHDFDYFSIPLILGRPPQVKQNKTVLTYTKHLIFFIISIDWKCGLFYCSHI